MKQTLYLRTLLIVAGITGISVGTGQLFFPVAFEASAGIDLGNDNNLLSEIRAAGGTLLTAGLIILCGAFRVQLARFALLLTMVFFLSYGFSRIYGMFADGMPGQSFIIVTIAEMAIGLGAATLFYYKKRKLLHAS